MRSVELIVHKEVGQARIGEIIDSINKLQFGTGYLVPYIRGAEDIEVALFNPDVFVDGQPVEICGFAAASILNKAIVLEERLKEDQYALTFLDFTHNHPMLMSFPPEVIWTGRERGLNHWEKSLRRFIQFSSPGFSEKEIDQLCGCIINAAAQYKMTYGFWSYIVNNSFKGERLSKLLMEWVITTATKMRCKYLSGLNPIINAKTPGSVVLNHRVNLAYAALVRDMEDAGLETPQYFYTIQLHSNMVQPDDWTNLLSEVVGYCRSALETTDMFSGIHIMVRNLENISKVVGRVRTMLKLFEELNRIGYEYKLPVWWSNFGLIGLAVLDEGGDFASFTPNMAIKDIITEAGPVEKDHQFGKVLNIHAKELWERKQTRKSRNRGYNLPKLNHFNTRNIPDDLELESPPLYRRMFSKPYNIAAMNELSLMWRENIENGEIRPGRHYLRDFSPPFNVWGLDL
ncbi:hypothetical protein DRP04_06930 [Archaeoglobales archaeon]|nr:MAG: hypothetical protein DRP04_06930 [Archaeoglobales archaeon]